jgi:hypothetical protein
MLYDHNDHNEKTNVIRMKCDHKVKTEMLTKFKKGRYRISMQIWLPDIFQK